MLSRHEDGVVDSPCLQLNNGVEVDLINPDYTHVRIEDVAHALSNMTRYNGHTDRRLSVAEHAVSVAYVLPDELKLEGLLHDGHEITFCDMPTPWKRVYGDIAREYELRHRKAFCKRFNTPVELHPLVKEADVRMLVTEMDQIFSKARRPANIEAEPYTHVTVHGHTPQVAYRSFMLMYEKLTS